MKKLLTIALILSTVLLAACSGDDPNDPRELIRIAGLSSTKVKGNNGFRIKILKETATCVGAQAGLVWRAEEIDCLLKDQSASLEKVYNFRALLLRDHVLPPVLSEGRQSLNLPSLETVRAADQVFRIIRPPRFVTVAPNWREYLWLSFKKPEDPSASLLPKDRHEAAMWNCFVKRGWDKGIEQANAIFIANLERLNRDYMGMVLYHRLYAQNMISAPFVAKADLGVTGDEHEMRINDRIMRIAATSRLNTDHTNWHAAVWPVKAAKLSSSQLATLPKTLEELPGPTIVKKKAVSLPEPTMKQSSNRLTIGYDE